MSDRGIHPDLVEEEQQAQAAVESPSPPRRGRAARAAPPAPPTEPVEAAPAPEAEAGEPASTEASTEPPEWWQQVKDAPDPKAALALLTKNMSREDVQRDPTLQGVIGGMAEYQAQQLLQRRQREQLEQQKREALANADFYGLGQLSAPELRQQVEQAQAGEQYSEFMQAVTEFQSSFDPEVQQQVQGKTYGAGKTPREGFVEYLKAITEAEASHRTEKELKRREPALRKAWLSESNGNQPVPELDGGRATGVREITDEQIGRMSLDEYEKLFDKNGRPNPGTRVRLTRAIDLRAQQR